MVKKAATKVTVDKKFFIKTSPKDSKSAEPQKDVASQPAMESSSVDRPTEKEVADSAAVETEALSLQPADADRSESEQDAIAALTLEDVSEFCAAEKIKGTVISFRTYDDKIVVVTHDGQKHMIEA